MFEVEQKFHVDDVAALVSRLESISAVPLPVQQHADSYFNHPCRDFAQTREALRVRRVDGRPMVTYKGTKLPGVIKARREMEWRLDPGDEEGSKMEELFIALGFRSVAVVRKTRCGYRLPDGSADLGVMIDEVEGLGSFAEIEAIVADQRQIEPARAKIEKLSRQLGLQRGEPRSYLRMILELDSAQ